MTQNKLGNLLNLSLTFVAVSLTANTLHFMTFYVMFKTRAVSVLNSFKNDPLLQVVFAFSFNC